MICNNDFNFAKDILHQIVNQDPNPPLQGQFSPAYAEQGLITTALKIIHKASQEGTCSQRSELSLLRHEIIALNTLLLNNRLEERVQVTLGIEMGEEAEKVMKVLFLVLGIVLFTLLTPFTAPIGAATRGLVSLLSSKPYIYLEQPGQGKSLPENKQVTLVSHNQCYMPGGYSITDGQVTPPSDRKRMDANIEKIKELNPDIICLYEVPDISDACYLSSQLTEYPFIIPVAGIRAIGPSSMMYIASKYEIEKDSIEFIPFIKGAELTGRAEYSEKGFLSFDVKSQGDQFPFATVISTHLQHSEIPSQPEESDRIARSLQMEKIAKQIQKKVEQGQNVIFTGDLNQEEEELNASLERHQIQWLQRDAAVLGQPTWGGDRWCAELMGKPSSGALVLDYTLIAKATAISTTIIGSGYSGLEFRSYATSDHDLMFSIITIS